MFFKSTGAPCFCSLHWITVLIWTFLPEWRLVSDPPWSSLRTPAGIGSSPKASAAEGHLRWCRQETWTRPAGSRVWRRPLTGNTVCSPPAAAHGHEWVFQTVYLHHVCGQFLSFLLALFYFRYYLLLCTFVFIIFTELTGDQFPSGLIKYFWFWFWKNYS